MSENVTCTVFGRYTQPACHREGLGRGRRGEGRVLKTRWNDMSVSSGSRPKMLHVMFSDGTRNQSMRMQQAKVLHAVFSILTMFTRPVTGAHFV